MGFKIGDLVRHRASGRQGVVVGASGDYRVATDFGEAKIVWAFEIEAVEEAPPADLGGLSTDGLLRLYNEVGSLEQTLREYEMAGLADELAGLLAGARGGKS